MARYPKMRDAAIQRLRDGRGLTRSQSDIVAFFQKTEGGQYGLQELSDRIGYCIPTLNNRLKELEQMGLLVITRHPDIWGPEGCNEYALTERGAWLAGIATRFT